MILKFIQVSAQGCQPFSALFKIKIDPFRPFIKKQYIRVFSTISTHARVMNRLTHDFFNESKQIVIYDCNLKF